MQDKIKRYWFSIFLFSCTLAITIWTLLNIEKKGNIVNIQIARPPVCLDPAKISSYEEKLIDGAIYDCLISYDPEKQESKGVLAEKWTVSESGKDYTFYLRKGLKFHDGSVVTARDVKYSWERVLNPECSNYGYLLRNLVGAEEVLMGAQKHVSGLKVIGTYTLRVSLKEPDWTFPAVVSSPALAIVSQKFVQKSGNKYGKNSGSVVGTGPFKMEKWDKKRILLYRNKRYPKDVPHFGALQFSVIRDFKEAKSLFESGEIDILAGISPNCNFFLNGSFVRGNRIIKKPVLDYYYLGFNMNDPVFGKNRELRRAISLALHKAKIRRQLLGEEYVEMNRILSSQLVAGQNQKNSDSSVFDKSVAFHCLAGTGHPYGINLNPLTFAYNGGYGNEYLARIIQDELGQVGINLHLRKLSWQDFKTGLKKGAYPFFRLGWEADYAEPGNILYFNFASSEIGWNNVTYYNNDVFDRFLKNARSESDHIKRNWLYSQAEEMLLTDIPVIPLFQRVSIFVLQKDIRNFHVDLLGRIDFLSIQKHFDS